MASQAEIVTSMIQQLAVSEPELDTNVGSVVRKILDAVAETLAEVSVDQYLLQYQYDIDSKTGADLDAMVALFGFTRLPAQRAIGEVTFSRATAPTLSVPVMAGALVATADGTAVYSTVVGGVIPIGSTSLTVPAIAVNGGTAANVGPGSVTAFQSPVNGVTAVTNPESMANGTDAESDAHLRERFKATIFRNMAGTEGMFLGVALDDPDVGRANVVGASKNWTEVLQFGVGNSTATSVVPDAVAVLPHSDIFGEDLRAGAIFGRDGAYSFNAGVVPPVVTRNNTTQITDTGLYELSFEYVPKCSRNSLANSISNRVDVYVSGQRPMAAAETVVFATAISFNNTSTSAYYRQNFLRYDETVPTNGNYFIPLSFGPLMPAFPNVDTFIVGGHTYTQGTDWWYVRDITAWGGGPRSYCGIELKSTGNGASFNPANGNPISLSYTYNDIPRAITASLNNWRLVGSDVIVHEARRLLLNVNLAVQTTPGVSIANIQTNIYAALSAYVASVGFEGTVQASDILEVAHQVSGVDAVRFLTDNDDASLYAIQRINEVTGAVMTTYSTGTTPKRATDIVVPNDWIPVLNAVHVIPKAQNLWGSV